MTVLVLKIAGLVTVLLGGFIALVGTTKLNRRYTPTAWLSLGIILAGFVFSIAIEIISFRESRADAQWQLTKSLPISSVGFVFMLDEQTTAEDLISLLNNLEISFYVDNSLEPISSALKIQWIYDPNASNYEGVAAIQLLSKDRPHKVSRATLLLQTANGQLYPSDIPANIEVSETGKGFLVDDFPAGVVGIIASFNWRDFGFGPYITTVQDLSRIAMFDFWAPKNSFFDPFQFAHMSVNTVGDFRHHFELDIKTLEPSYGFTQEKRQVTLSGEEFLRMWELSEGYGPRTWVQAIFGY